MAIYQVGQRVKRIAGGPLAISYHLIPVGTEGTVAKDAGADVVAVHWDGIRLDGKGPGGSWLSLRITLAPLTDPKADEFIERIKKLKPYEEPVAPKFAPEKFAPTAEFNGMTLVCTEEGVWALRNGVWTKVNPCGPLGDSPGWPPHE